MMVSVVVQKLSTAFNGVAREFTTPGSPSVWQFRGIKYGNIPARFMQATLNESFPNVLDTTNYGPKCPQPPFPTRLESVLIGIPPQVHPKNQPDVFDEFGCLNLNITMPPLNPAVSASLPVMVYVHGGGGFSGSNSDWWCDGAPLVSKSIAIGKPIVHVAINYRISALGFMGSSELRQELGDTNGGNYGIHDIHLALTWVARNIASFGGSSDQITVYGESFGSVAVETLLHSNLTPLFSRCILQSQLLGTPYFTTPESINTKSFAYERTKKHLNVKTVKDLQNIPAQDLITALAASDPRGGLGHVPMIDDILLSENWQTHFNFTRGRGGSVMIGNTGFEGAVITALLAAQPKPASPSSTSSLISLLHGSISADKTQGLVDAYQIHDDPGHLNLYQVKQNILKLLQDLAFYRPPYSSISALKAKTPPSKVYRYAFLKSNIFEGPFHNLSAHALDLAYIHGDSSLFTGTANESSELIFQDKIKEIWINFADGDSIWDDDKWMVMGGKGAPFGLLQRTEVQFENEMDRTSLAWPAVDALSNSDKEAVTSILMGHLVGLGGVDASHVNGGA